jgi:hypothetical protein
MSMTRKVRSLAAHGLTLLVLLSIVPASLGQENCQTCCPSTCNRWDCPPYFKYCQEGSPRICIQCGCPKPVCCPSDAPNWGYYQRCWRPWPWAPNWSHCYGVPPASQLVPPLSFAGEAAHPSNQLPAPRVVPTPH